MDTSFGARLRARREQQQVTLADIAEQTKIKVSLLAALERDDVSQWPSGIFRRSYVRMYARAIGLDPDAVAREFLERYPDPDAESASTLRGVDGSVTKGRPPTRLGFMIASALEALPMLRTPAVSKPSEVTPGLAALTDTADDGPFLAAAPLRTVTVADDWKASALSASPAEALDTHRQPAVADPSIETEAAPPARACKALVDLAALCSRLARITDSSELGSAFEEAATLVDAQGVILWMWDAQAALLRPVLGHGYPHELLARLNGVSRDDDNAVSAAFRTSEVQEVNGRPGETGAIVVPLIAPTVCTGVLAFELSGSRDRDGVAKACAVVIAAQLATLMR